MNSASVSGQPLYTTPTTSKNNQFVANYIHDNQQQMNDGGAFYELSASPGTVFSQNYVKAPTQSAGTNFGTYSDEGTRYLTFSQNVFNGGGRGRTSTAPTSTIVRNATAPNSDQYGAAALSD